MEQNININLIWWITAFELPAMAGLFLLIWRTRRDTDAGFASHRQRIEQALSAAAESLSSFKLEVAKGYVSMPYMKDVERRLTGHLLRIEAKIDTPREGRDR